RCSRDYMKEGAGDVAAPAAAVGHRLPLRVGQLSERDIMPCRYQARIVEFMTAHARTCHAEWTVRCQPGLAIAEVQLAFVKAGGVPEQAGHRMRNAIGVFKAFAEHHVATAFAMHRACRGETRETVAEPMRGCERAGMQFRIAARQP